MSPDPLGEVFPNSFSYRYGKNNPLKFNDPTGLFDTKAEAQKYSDKKFPGAEVHQDTQTQQWFVSLNEDATAAYTSGSVLTRDFGPDKEIASMLGAVNISVGTLSTYMVFEGKYYKWNEIW